MTAHPDILDQRDSLKGAFLGAIALHVAIFGGMALRDFLGKSQTFGAPDAGGGAIGITAVKSIPLIHHGAPNPVANESESQVPQTPVKAKEAAKRQKTPSPDAIPIKDRAKRKPQEVASAKRIFRPFEELDPNQLTARQAPQVSNPIYNAIPGAGRIGVGENTTLGNKFPGYAAQIQRLVAQKWRTNEVDARLQTAPPVIATFDLMRNGTIRNLRLLQASGISTLDLSVQRAVTEAAPFPPMPPGMDKDSVGVEFWFELKR